MGIASYKTAKKDLKRRQTHRSLLVRQAICRGYAENTSKAKETLTSLSCKVRRQIRMGFSHSTEDDCGLLGQDGPPLCNHLDWIQVAYKISLTNEAQSSKTSSKAAVPTRWQINFDGRTRCDDFSTRVRQRLAQIFMRRLWSEKDGIPEWRFHSRRQLKYGGDKWCAEFSNNRRPVSTTWPWSIRPSLAVLWGVCWMFYPQQGESAGQQRYQHQQHQQQQQQPQPQQPQQQQQQQQRRQGQFGWQTSFSFGEPMLTGENSQQLLSPATTADSRHNSSTSTSGLPPGSEQISNRMVRAQGENSLLPRRPTTQALAPQALGYPSSQSGIHQSENLWATPEPYLSPRGSNSAASRRGSAAAQRYDIKQHASQRVQEPTRQQPEDPGVGSSTDNSILASLTWHQPRHGFPPTAPTANSSPSPFYGQPGPPILTPSYVAGVTGTHTTQPPSYSSPFINPRSRPQAFPPSSSLDSAYDFWQYQPSVAMSDRASEGLEPPPPTAQMHPMIDPAVTAADPASGPKGVSEEPSSPDGHEQFSPRRGFTHKRSEDPPRNDAGKMICRFQNTCGGLIFERRCEWSKHMDKHERPYKCNAPGCEKLQGFTYSGGLLRHQREVHKMHGGTKKALYCPEPNCKRNSGSGFTRKENLSEHIRRVHRRQTSLSEGAAPRTDPNVDPVIDQLQQAAAAQLQAEEAESLSALAEASNKRKLEDGENDVEMELKKVKRVIKEKDERIEALEQQVALIQKQLQLRNGEHHFDD